MEKDSLVKFPEKSPLEPNGGKKALRCLSILVVGILLIHSVSVWYLRNEVHELQKKILVLEMRAEVDTDMLKSLQSLIYSELENAERSEEDALLANSEENNLMENEEVLLSEEESNDGDDGNLSFKRKREIRDYNESFQEKSIENDAENKPKIQRSSTESSSVEKSSEFFSKEAFFSTSNAIFASSTRKPHLHRKHRKSRGREVQKEDQYSRIQNSLYHPDYKEYSDEGLPLYLLRKSKGAMGSAERFFTETHSTTSTPIQVRQSRTKITQMQGIDKAIWLQNQRFQQHTSPHKDTITKEEALRKGFARHLESPSYELDTSTERSPDALSYNMITIHFSADTSHYSRERDPHYFGNGRMQIKSEVYKDWKPAHWTQGIGMSKYFHLHQGRVTVSTTGIYLIYAQIQYSNVQEVNGFSVFRNKEVVVQCITTSTHPDRHEIKSNTCGISTTILLQSNDSVCIKDLHHGRYVVLTPEKSYFGLVLLSPFKN